MHIDELKLPDWVQEKLAESGLDTVSAALDAGTDGLQAIDGIGPKTADEILEAAQHATASNGNGDTAHEDDAEVVNHAEVPEAAPNGNGSADPKVALPAADADPDEVVTVRNVSAAMVLVGERYLLPGQRRTVRRRQIRHIAPGKLEIR